MVLHCAAGDEPWVYYRFAGGPWQKIQIKAAPIEVVVADELSRNVFKGTVTQTQTLRIPANQRRVSIQILKNSNSSALICYRMEETPNKNWGFFGGFGVFTTSYKGLLSIYAFNQSSTVEAAENLSGSGGQELKINYQGSLMFSKLGKSPCEYKVACADCPPGFLKCERASGHYCMPLSEVRPSIAYIKSNLRTR